MSGTMIQVNRERAHASLHALSQPLTVMSLALTIVQGAQNETERAQALEAMVTECRRAIGSVNRLRALLDEEAEVVVNPEWRKASAGERVDWMFGGMA